MKREGRRLETSGTFDFTSFDKRPVIVVLAGPNGAGKTTFFYAHLPEAGLRFLNPDVIARELGIDAYAAARVVGAIRDELVRQGESFVFETVFSDPVGDKLSFLKRAIQGGYNVVLCFIGLATAALSEERVSMRVSQGGHDVPTVKLLARFPRTLANLKAAVSELPHVLVFDNTNLDRPFRQVAIYEKGRLVFAAPPIPRWLPK